MHGVKHQGRSRPGQRVRSHRRTTWPALAGSRPGMCAQPPRPRGNRTTRSTTLDRFGTLLTEHGTRTHRAIVDSGANGFVFASDTLAICARNRAFYCPMAGGTATSAPQSAAIVGRNGQRETVAFTVDNIDQLFAGQAALPGLAAPASGMIGGAASLFAWGLPFFFGRTVHVLFEGHTVGDVSGPAIGF